MEDPRTFGVVVTDENDVVHDFIEKPNTMEHKQVLAGIYWFKNGRLLYNAIQTIIEENRQTKGEFYLVDAYKVMLEQGAVIKAKPTIFWLDAGKPDYMLSTNQKLLSLGYGTQDAIERSYAEDFTVVPPVFIHETAVIDQSVIGPFASIDAGATVKRSVVRNSIIDAGAHIENCVLDEALVGENARLTGQPKAMFVGDDSNVEIG
jgi:glucose-1-phosphate thymidylyltransferase